MLANLQPGLGDRFCLRCLCRDGFYAGPIFDQFSLTLDSGRRTEAVGPFFYDQQKDPEKTWAIPPLLSYDADPANEAKEFDLGYPLLTYESYGGEYRWQLCQLLSFAGGQSPRKTPRKNALRCFRSIFSNVRRTRTKITPRCFHFTATFKTGCSVTIFSSSCFPFTARLEGTT